MPDAIYFGGVSYITDPATMHRTRRQGELLKAEKRFNKKLAATNRSLAQLRGEPKKRIALRRKADILYQIGRLKGRKCSWEDLKLPKKMNLEDFEEKFELSAS